MTHQPLHPLPTNLLRTSLQSIQSSFAVYKDNAQQKTDEEGQTNSRQDMQKKRKIQWVLKSIRHILMIDKHAKFCDELGA